MRLCHRLINVPYRKLGFLFYHKKCIHRKHRLLSRWIFSYMILSAVRTMYIQTTCTGIWFSFQVFIFDIGFSCNNFFFVRPASVCALAITIINKSIFSPVISIMKVLVCTFLSFLDFSPIDLVVSSNLFDVIRLKLTTNCFIFHGTLSINKWILIGILYSKTCVYIGILTVSLKVWNGFPILLNENEI